MVWQFPKGTALHVAAKAGLVEAAERLLLNVPNERGCDIYTLLDARDQVELAPTYAV